MKLLSDEHHILTCCHYIHQNPLKARLVEQLEDWHPSSFKDYLDLNRPSICSREILNDLIQRNGEQFHKISHQSLEEKAIAQLYQASDAFFEFCLNLTNPEPRIRVSYPHRKHAPRVALSK